MTVAHHTGLPNPLRSCGVEDHRGNRDESFVFILLCGASSPAAEDLHGGHVSNALISKMYLPQKS